MRKLNKSQFDELVKALSVLPNSILDRMQEGIWKNRAAFCRQFVMAIINARKEEENA